MKKKALVVGVLLSVFSMGMSAYAEKTLNIKDTTRNDLTYDYNTKLSGSTSGAVVRINVTRDQKITFNNSLSSTGAALSSEEFKITQNNTVGILHDSTATTTIDGNGLWISSTSHLDNVKSIVNQSGILKFTNTRLLVSGKVENAAGATMMRFGKDSVNGEVFLLVSRKISKIYYPVEKLKIFLRTQTSFICSIKLLGIDRF